MYLQPQMKKVTKHIAALTMSALLSTVFAVSASAKPPHAKGKGKGLTQAPGLTQTYAPDTRNELPQWAQQRISYSQAKAIAMSRYPGAQYLDTRLSGDTYTVLLRLPNTQRVKVRIDAVTGRIR